MEANISTPLTSAWSGPPPEPDLATFCSRLRPRLVSALRTDGDAELAEDIAQEALSRATTAWSRIRLLDKPENYVFQIAFNLRRSWWRRRNAEQRALSRLDPATVWCEHDSAETIELRRAVERLPPRQREAIVNRYYLGLDVREAAASMNCAEGTVRALSAQALSSLRASDLAVAPGQRDFRGDRPGSTVQFIRPALPHRSSRQPRTQRR